MFASAKKTKTAIGVLATLLTLAGCGDDSSVAGVDMQASVEGRVEETSSPPSAPARSAPQQAPAGSAQTVAVVQVQSDGSYTELATADVDGSGAFTVTGVPAGRSDLAVVAYADGRDVGSVLIHEETRAGATIVAAPIDAETTLEARAYSRFRASTSGEANSSAEMSLFVHGDGFASETAASSQAEIDAMAAAYATASATVTAAYAASGVALDAASRADLYADAAVDFAARRSNGMSLSAAHDLFTEAALDALVDADADLAATVLAHATAASTFDAALTGASSVRGDFVVQPLLINLEARERLAASYASSAEGSVATAVRGVLADARGSLLLVGGLVDIRSLIEATLSSVVDAGAEACVQLLASGASTSVQADVRAAAQAAIQTAQLGARLETATTAEAAAGVLAQYRSDVHAAVEAMIQASGNTTADADVLTEIFIAASAGAYIRA